MRRKADRVAADFSSPRWRSSMQPLLSVTERKAIRLLTRSCGLLMSNLAAERIHEKPRSAGVCTCTGRGGKPASSSCAAAGTPVRSASSAWKSSRLVSDGSRPARRRRGGVVRCGAGEKHGGLREAVTAARTS